MGFVGVRQVEDSALANNLMAGEQIANSTLSAFYYFLAEELDLIGIVSSDL